MYRFHSCCFPRRAPISGNPSVSLVSAAVPDYGKDVSGSILNGGRTLTFMSIVDRCTQVKPSKEKLFTSRVHLVPTLRASRSTQVHKNRNHRGAWERGDKFHQERQNSILVQAEDRFGTRCRWREQPTGECSDSLWCSGMHSHPRNLRV